MWQKSRQPTVQTTSCSRYDELHHIIDRQVGPPISGKHRRIHIPRISSTNNTTNNTTIFTYRHTDQSYNHRSFSVCHLLTTMSTLYCNQCQCDKDFLLCDKNVKGGGYSSLQCDECQYKCVQCHECKAVFSCKNSDYRSIKKHIKNKHGLATTIPLIDPSNFQTEEPTSSPLSIRATYDRQCLDVLYEEDVEKDTEATSFDAMDESENFLNIELHESFETLARSFTPENVSLDARNYPNFGNDTSNTYFEQDFKMYHEEGQLFGGMRGVCWRSRYKLSLHDIESIANMDDAKFMLNITKLFASDHVRIS